MIGNRRSKYEHIAKQLSPHYPIEDFAQEFIDYCANTRGYSECTMRTRRTHLKQFIEYLENQGATDVSVISNRLIDAYFNDFLTGHCQNTANTGRRIIRAFIRWINDYKELNTPARPDLISLVKVRDNLPKAIPKDTIVKVIAGASNYQDSLMIATMFEAGLRISELVSLRVKDLGENSMTVIGKGNIERVVYISETLAKTLSKFAKDNDRHDYLFLNEFHNYRDRHMTTKTACRRIERTFEETAGLKMHPHQLRHSLAICLLENGADLVTIQRVLGHADISTTMVYLKVKNEFVEKGYNQHLGGSVLA